MEYHVPSWAVVKTWRDENLLSLYVVYTCFDGFRRNKEIVSAERERERESKATETRARVEEKGLLDEIQYSRIFNRGFPRFVSAGMRRGACFASSSIKKQESSLLRIRGQRTFNFPLLPCAAAVTLIFINADHPRGRFFSPPLSPCTARAASLLEFPPAYKEKSCPQVLLLPAPLPAILT